MEEQQILSEDGVQVTSSRLIAGGQTFALRNITSVRMAPGGSMLWAVVWLVVAVLALIGNNFSSGGVLGFVIFGALGGLLLVRALSRRIVINTSGKDQVAYSTGNRPHAERVFKALNDAIALR